jgi:hypothetical protein
VFTQSSQTLFTKNTQVYGGDCLIYAIIRRFVGISQDYPIKTSVYLAFSKFGIIPSHPLKYTDEPYLQSVLSVYFNKYLKNI